MFEITTFSLRAGAAVDAFLVADARVQAEWAYQQPGIVRRTTARGDGDRWAVVTLWDDAATAAAAAATATSAPAVVAFEAFIDESSSRTECFELLPG